MGEHEARAFVVIKTLHNATQRRSSLLLPTGPRATHNPWNPVHGPRLCARTAPLASSGFRISFQVRLERLRRWSHGMDKAVEKDSANRMSAFCLPVRSGLG